MQNASSIVNKSVRKPANAECVHQTKRKTRLIISTAKQSRVIRTRDNMTVQELIKHLQSLPQDIPVYLHGQDTPEVLELKTGPKVSNLNRTKDGSYTSIPYDEYIPIGWTRHQGIIF